MELMLPGPGARASSSAAEVFAGKGGFWDSTTGDCASAAEEVAASKAGTTDKPSKYVIQEALDIEWLDATDVCAVGSRASTITDVDRLMMASVHRVTFERKNFCSIVRIAGK